VFNPQDPSRSATVEYQRHRQQAREKR